MIVVPFYNLVVVPEVTFYFQGEYFKEIAGQDAEKGDEILFLMLKEDKQREDMTPEDFYPIGVTGVVENLDKDGNIGIKTLGRVDINSVEVDKDDIKTTFSDRIIIEDIDSQQQKERFEQVKSAVLQYINGFQWGIMVRNYVVRWKSMEEMIANLSNHLNISNEEKYEILAADKISQRFELMEQVLYEFIEVSKIGEEAKKVQTEAHEKVYREEAIKKQIEILQNELDEMHPENVSDIRKFEQKIRKSHMNEIAKNEAEKVLNRMKQEGKDSHEYGMLYDYLDFVTGLSWEKETFSDINLVEAEEILNQEHYGLKKAKERIIQQIAVMALNKQQSGSILLFVGAPGTGKTSIGQSVAKALKREYVRVSLGGIRDEAEIRGHRRTYVGAMPGRIMDGIKRSGVSNPVMVLDEVDKMVKDYGGDPSSALLEVLDPEHSGINLFDNDWKIYSRNSGKTSHKITETAVVENCMITDGCRIAGHVKRSILFSGVKVAEGAEVEDAVIMGGTVIESGAVVKHCIVAENVVIGQNAVVGEMPHDGEKGVATIGSGIHIGERAKVGPNAMVNANVKDGEEEW